MLIDTSNPVLFHALSALYWIINGFVFASLGVSLIVVIFTPLTADVQKVLEINSAPQNEHAVQRNNELKVILARSQLVNSMIKSTALTNVPGFFIVGGKI